MSQTYSITYIIFLIFAGTAILSTLALITRQSLLVAYIAIGAILGPWGLKFIPQGEVIHQAGEIGIIFLLFLLGLHLQPQNLFHSLRKMSLITLWSSLAFFIIGFVPTYLFGYNFAACVLVGIATTFSSTIIGIKLLPTTILHHQHTGELAVSILLLQDVLAILTLLGLKIVGTHQGYSDIFIIITAFPILIFAAYLCQRFILGKLLAYFDKIHEYIFILSIGWCLCMAEFAHFFGLSEEIGAFIGGVALASNPIAFYIAENLKPLRDFFLVIFFFTIGARFNFGYLPDVYMPAITLAALVLLLKPIIFYFLLYRAGEVKIVSWEIGVRLGQMSEFSLLVMYLGLAHELIAPKTAYMVQAAVILTFIVSCYWTVFRYPTPLSPSDRMRRD